MQNMSPFLIGSNLIDKAGRRLRYVQNARKMEANREALGTRLRYFIRFAKKKSPSFRLKSIAKRKNTTRQITSSIQRRLSPELS